MSELRVVDATTEDLAWIAASAQAMARESENKTLDPDTVASGVAQLHAHPDRGFYLMAWRGDARAGTLMVTPEWSDWRNAWFWWIQSVYVDPAHRRAGVYRRLHEAVVRRARAQGEVCGIRLYVDRDNGGAMATYRALGMDGSNYQLFEQSL